MSKTLHQKQFVSFQRKWQKHLSGAAIDYLYDGDPVPRLAIWLADGTKIRWEDWHAHGDIGSAFERLIRRADKWLTEKYDV